MLGSDRFTFETPNVIDPGDVAPSAPSRKTAAKSTPTPTKRPAYQAERTQRIWADISGEVEVDFETGTAFATNADEESDEESRGFLAAERDEKKQNENWGFQDNTSTGRELYYDDDVGPHYDGPHSLPNVEEARTYAASLLHSSNKTRPGGSSSQDPFAGAIGMSDEPSLGSYRKKSIDRNHSSKHLLRRELTVFLAKVFGVILVFILIILIIVLSVTRSGKDKGTASAVEETYVPPPPPTRLDLTYTFIRSALLTSVVDLKTPGTPQYMAANWIANMDVLELDVPAAPNAMGAQQFIQRFVLAALFFSTKGSESWIQKAGFLSDQSECGWFNPDQRVWDANWGSNYALGVTCNTDLEVVNLLLPSNGLQGSIPQELGYLTAMTLISMPHNQLNGTIPYSFVNMVDIEYIDLKFNFLKGRIPNVFMTLDNLQVLGLSNNYLDKSLPPSIMALTNLKTLSLDDNLLTGDLEYLNNLTSLEYLYADRNQFQGPVDDRFLPNLQQLVELDVSGNQLKGGHIGTIHPVFPKHLLQHPKLKVLDLAENEIDASLPTGLQNNNVLKFLSLRDNKLNGVVDATNLPMLKGLQHLDIAGNMFTGKLPYDMRFLSNLSFLFMGRNHQLTPSSFPSWLFYHKQLEELSMTEMNLLDDIPPWLIELQSLTFLDVSHNLLTGNIPTEVLNLPNLGYLLVHNNSLGGPMTQNISKADKFQFLTIYDNDGFTGDLNFFCDRAPMLQLLAVDCSEECGKDCCPECCDRQATAGVDAVCFKQAIPTYLRYFEGLWELNYTSSVSPYDPALITDKPGILHGGR